MADDFDISEEIEADRRSRKEWEAAVSRAKSTHFPGCGCESCVKMRADYPPYLITKDGSVRRISEAEDEAFRRYAHREFAAADMKGSDVDHPVATERKTVAGHVADILSDLQSGRCTRSEAVEVGRAAERAIADHDVSRSIGKL